MNTPDFLESPPVSDSVTDYDEQHFVTYLRLLDAAADDADWREIAKLVFGIDPLADPQRAKSVHDAHLDRARWMAKSGYTQLLSRN